MDKSEDLNTIDKDLMEYSNQAMLTYGSEVIEGRALPDFRDGLKPVQRRVLFATFKLGANSKAPHTKAARIVGETIGKYHCHGDAAAFEAMVKLSTSVGSAHVFPKCKSIDGSGNWGNLTDGNAAQRYINARLSKYADSTFFDKKYMAVSKMVDNYDGKDKEPLILPSLLPNLFLMGGISGIAVGVTTKIPSYSVKSLAKLVVKCFEGKKIDSKACMKLEFQYPYGGIALLDTKERTSELKTFYETGEGKVDFSSRAEINTATRSVIITNIAPELNLSSAIVKAEDLYCVKRVEDLSDISGGYKYKIHVKNNIPKKEVASAFERIEKVFSTSLRFKTNITIRFEEENGSVAAKFKASTIPKIINNWCKWRISLEVAMLTRQIEITQVKLDYQKLMLLAVINRSIIIKSLDLKDTEAFLSKKLKITLEQAKQILDLRVRQLRKMDSGIIKSAIKSLSTDLSDLKNHKKNPGIKIISDIKSLIISLT